MYINKLVLENFQFVNRVYHTKRLTLDMSNRTSNICIIAGPNGSGKTFLLSSLTPFSNLGGVDVRDTNSPIEKGESGYKEIELCNGNDTYNIQHYYSPSKTSHSVKSFIQKNGVEKNENGNVTSFKKYLSDELGITPNYMKLLRLGGNVKSLISAKATERKEIITEMLNNMNDTLDYILNYNKISTERLKGIKQVIANLSSQIDRLYVTSLDGINNQIDILKNQSNDYSIRLEELRKEKGALEYVIESIGDIDEIKKTYKEAQKQYANIDKGLKTIPSDITLDEIESSLSNLNSTMTAAIRTRDILISRRDAEMEALDKNISQKEELSQILKRMEDTETEIKELIKLRSDLIDKCTKVASDYDGFNPKINVDEVKSIISILSTLQSKLDVVYAFGEKPVKQVIELINSGTDVLGYIESHIIAYHIAEAEREHSSTIIRELTSIIDLAEPLQCVMNCPGKKLYDHIKEISSKKIESPTEDDEFLNYMRHIYTVISDSRNTLFDNKGLISKLPTKISEEFTDNKILKRIEKRVPIYDITLLNDFLTYLTNYEIYIKDLEEVKRLKKEIDDRSKTSEFAYFTKQMESLDESIEEHKTSISELKYLVENTDKDVDKCEDKISEHNRWKDVLLHKEELSIALKELSDKISSYDEAANKLKNDIILNEDICIRHSQLCTKELYELEYKKRSYIDLTAQLKQQTDLYDKINIIKKATSTKEGIPMYMLMAYLQKIKNEVNELLSNGYSELKIADFILSADEFNIPYIVRDEYLVDDVNFASQGEQTFLGTALAIAISSMRYTLKKHDNNGYNVYYLDEVDGPLDIEKSSKWIEFLKSVFQTADVEQAFVITHKNMFSSYLVDLIVTDESFFSDGDIDEMYPLSNRIDIIRENE